MHLSKCVPCIRGCCSTLNTPTSVSLLVSAFAVKLKHSRVNGCRETKELSVTFKKLVLISTIVVCKEKESRLKISKTKCNSSGASTKFNYFFHKPQPPHPRCFRPLFFFLLKCFLRAAEQHKSSCWFLQNDSCGNFIVSLRRLS